MNSNTCKEAERISSASSVEQSTKWKSPVLKAGIFSAALLVLSGCGGGGDGGSAAAGVGGSTSTQPTLTGKAIDGYLVNAKVCVDLNDNNVCDAGEPQGKTDQAGNYSLAFDGDVTGKKLLVLVTPDTRDLSRPNYVFPAAFALTASIDGTSGQNVTPLTTMQQSLMEQGYSRDAAAKAVVSFVGGAVNLRGDYIANGDSTTGAFAMQVVDKVAQFAKNGAVDANTVRGLMNAIVLKRGINNVTQADVDALAAKPVLSTDVDAGTVLADNLYGYHEYLGLNGVGSVQTRNRLIQNGDGVRMALEAYQNSQWTEPNSDNFTSYIGHYQMKADGSWTNLLGEADQHKASPVVSAVGNTLTLSDAITGGGLKIEFRRVNVGGKTFVEAMTDWIKEDYIREALQGSFPATAEGVVGISYRDYDNIELDLQTCGVDQSQYIVQDGVSHCNWVGDKGTTYTSLDQIIGTEFIMNGLLKVMLNADGTAVMKDRYSGQTLLAGPKFTWVRHPVNPNVAIFRLNSADIRTLPIPYQNEIAEGGNVVLALHAGRIQVGSRIPAAHTSSFIVFKKATFDQLFAAVNAVPM
ncbi:hypothetical protein [Ralstonia pseudosolanacearum]|uniref:hypothetical protein n=1 Tax=Ralstonia pseudosolanacearum TaxID=1310165 RepID=UPI0018CFF3A6|nr:hypothetical protein [Ralstonia pseudosolanacearum]UWD91460.1 hypothetical protein NY025_10575 [Ralstonia pseudosolanacearum]CAH0441069.1 hypothetical protein LMG9673_01865 [Ralstonia pseudosolanacearum]